MRKTIAILCAVTVLAGSMPAMADYTAKAVETETGTEFNGDIIKNPWGELFTETEAPTAEAPTPRVKQQLLVSRKLLPRTIQIKLILEVLHMRI